MVAKKHPKRKLVQDFTYENIFARARKITPKGYTYDSVFWETTFTATGIVRCGVGIYKQRGVSDLQLYLDTKETRTRRAATAESYGTLAPIQSTTTGTNYKSVPIPENLPPKKHLAIVSKRGPESMFYHLWAAVRDGDKALLSEARKQKLEIPLFTPYAEVAARLKREASSRPRKKSKSVL